MFITWCRRWGEEAIKKGIGCKINYKKKQRVKSRPVKRIEAGWVFLWGVLWSYVIAPMHEGKKGPWPIFFHPKHPWIAAVTAFCLDLLFLSDAEPFFPLIFSLCIQKEGKPHNHWEPHKQFSQNMMSKYEGESLGDQRHFIMHVLLPQGGIELVPLGLWTPVWFRFVGQDEEEEKEAAPLALRTHCKNLVTWRQACDLHIPWNAFDMLWFLERDEALHTENPRRGTAEAAKKKKEGGGKENKKRRKRTRRKLMDELRCRLTCWRPCWSR